MTDKTVKEILADIQARINVPKGQTNAFGKYKYRSCEDIVEAVKPLLAEHGAYLLLGDVIEQIGERYYVKATAVISHCGAEVYAQAYAREPLTKKGMDEAQITGATSSYARKYALNGLLAIDDTKDADTVDNRNHTQISEDHAKSNMDGTKIDIKKLDSVVTLAIEIIDDDENIMSVCRDKLHEIFNPLTNDEKIYFGEQMGKRKLKNVATGREKGYAATFKECYNYEGEES